MKKSKSIVIHDFIMENFENGGAFRFDVLSGKTQLKTVLSDVNCLPQTTQKDYIYPYLSLGLPESETLPNPTNTNTNRRLCLQAPDGAINIKRGTAMVSPEIDGTDIPDSPDRFRCSGGAINIKRRTGGHCIEQWEDVTDRDLCTIAYRCSEETNMNVSPKDILNVLQSNDVVAAVHPLRDYLERLPQYDPQCGMDVIELMSNHVRVVGDEAAQQMWRRCFRRWFLSMVQSWRKDEVVNHQVLVLIGPQGIYKTTWLEHLLPPELRAYQCKQASTRELSKDDRIRIAENALINLDEIDAMSPRELNVLKSVITAADINERAAYGYTKQRRVRCASFCASGNNKQFLNDDTGNRRWLPFEVESIDSPFDTDMMMPYQMLYAQAVYELEHGAAYYFDRDETDALSQHNETFRMPRNEEDLLPVYFRAATREDAEAKFMTASEIHGRLKVVGNIEKLMPINKFGFLLQKNGFVQTKYRGTRGYVVVENSTPSQNQKDIAQELLSQDVY